MCLLHTHPASTVFDEADITDFYQYNSDGVGVMWAEDGVLYTRKYLPPTAKAAWEFYKEHILGKDCVVHWRMKTHGKIDLENCHPYPIFGAGSKMPMSLMHNGVLSSGNAKDVTKSDTWHYVADVLRPLLKDAPEMFLNPVMQELIREHIGGGNRFIIMNHKGETAIINESSFVTYKGAKLSNTYAWSAEKGGFAGRYSPKSSWYSGYDDLYEPYGGYYRGTTTTQGSWKDTQKTSSRHRANEEVGKTGKTVSAITTAFFQTLRQRGYNVAYYELTYLEVEAAVAEDGLIWIDFIEMIERDELTDEQIVACVNDPDITMLNLVYGIHDDDQTQQNDGLTDGDIDRINAEAERRAEQQRLTDEILALQTGQDGNLHPYY